MAWTDNKKPYDIVPQSWLINYVHLYKISDEVMKFTEEIMKNCWVELTAGGKSLVIFQEDALSPLLFVIAMMLLNLILRKWTESYKLTKSQEKINLLIKGGGARGVMVIVVGNGHGDSSSNPGRDWLHFT